MISQKKIYLSILLLLACSFCAPRQPVGFYDKSNFVAPSGYSDLPPKNPQVNYAPQTGSGNYTPYVPYNYQPYSRGYSNPYASPQNYQPYYDSDHYYIPPTNYNQATEPAHLGRSAIDLKQ